MATGQRLHLVYESLDALAGRFSVENPKGHDVPAIAASIDHCGYADPVVVNDRDGRVLSGHGRIETLLARCAAGLAAPTGIDIDPTGTGWPPSCTGWTSISRPRGAS